ncbi:MAG: 1-(5-phosphoribosyl)-5-[(5-phosphoribosylamino)methylideneamino]imidazole-4-carboxamide isomerase [SAR324 cluster bacterium]|nr:1-(5-phosphoribosyl)-5-[(5-phosphoribosylamino)methylideneamino]imidazole-4-carboxamide isomerase [SAR324 cluster bacterium]
MIVLPAIDLKDGNCVRLVQGRADRETVYGTDPAAVARRFADEGAQMLHLVDLDGAFSGKTANLEAIAAIRAAVTLPLELGGGMRSLDDVAGMLELGIDSVILGTMAVRHPQIMEQALARFGSACIQLGVDARGGKVSVQGWAEDTALDAVQFARSWRERGVQRAVFTDISRDGMMSGPNLEATRAFAAQTGLRVTASGGVSSPEDLLRLAELEDCGVDRAIVGKAIYEGAVQLSQVL